MKCEAWAVVCDGCNRLGPLALDIQRAEDDALQLAWTSGGGQWACPECRLKRNQGGQAG